MTTEISSDKIINILHQDYNKSADFTLPDIIISDYFIIPASNLQIIYQKEIFTLEEICLNLSYEFSKISPTSFSSPLPTNNNFSILEDYDRRNQQIITQNIEKFVYFSILTDNLFLFKHLLNFLQIKNLSVKIEIEMFQHQEDAYILKIKESHEFFKLILHQHQFFQISPENAYSLALNHRLSEILNIYAEKNYPFPYYHNNSVIKLAIETEDLNLLKNILDRKLIMIEQIKTSDFFNDYYPTTKKREIYQYLDQNYDIFSLTVESLAEKSSYLIWAVLLDKREIIRKYLTEEEDKIETLNIDYHVSQIVHDTPYSSEEFENNLGGELEGNLERNSEEKLERNLEENIEINSSDEYDISNKNNLEKFNSEINNPLLNTKYSHFKSPYKTRKDLEHLFNHNLRSQYSRHLQIHQHLKKFPRYRFYSEIFYYIWTSNNLEMLKIFLTYANPKLLQYLTDNRTHYLSKKVRGSIFKCSIQNLEMMKYIVENSTLIFYFTELDLTQLFFTDLERMEKFILQYENHFLLSREKYFYLLLKYQKVELIAQNIEKITAEDKKILFDFAFQFENEQIMELIIRNGLSFKERKYCQIFHSEKYMELIKRLLESISERDISEKNNFEENLEKIQENSDKILEKNNSEENQEILSDINIPKILSEKNISNKNSFKFLNLSYYTLERACQTSLKLENLLLFNFHKLKIEEANPQTALKLLLKISVQNGYFSLVEKYLDQLEDIHFDHNTLFKLAILNCQVKIFNLLMERVQDMRIMIDWLKEFYFYSYHPNYLYFAIYYKYIKEISLYFRNNPEENHLLPLPESNLKKFVDFEDNIVWIMLNLALSKYASQLLEMIFKYGHLYQINLEKYYQPIFMQAINMNYVATLHILKEYPIKYIEENFYDKLFLYACQEKLNNSIEVFLQNFAIDWSYLNYRSFEKICENNIEIFIKIYDLGFLEGDIEKEESNIKEGNNKKEGNFKEGSNKEESNNNEYNKEEKNNKDDNKEDINLINNNLINNNFEIIKNNKSFSSSLLNIIQKSYLIHLISEIIFFHQDRIDIFKFFLQKFQINFTPVMTQDILKSSSSKIIQLCLENKLITSKNFLDHRANLLLFLLNQEKFSILDLLKQFKLINFSKNRAFFNILHIQKFSILVYLLDKIEINLEEKKYISGLILEKEDLKALNKAKNIFSEITIDFYPLIYKDKIKSFQFLKDNLLIDLKKINLNLLDEFALSKEMRKILEIKEFDLEIALIQKDFRRIFQYLGIEKIICLKLDEEEGNFEEKYEDVECIICKDRYLNDNMLVLECAKNHFCHFECLYIFLREKNDKTCPYCRKNFSWRNCKKVLKLSI